MRAVEFSLKDFAKKQRRQEFPARLLKSVVAGTIFWENFEWKRSLILDTDQGM